MFMCCQHGDEPRSTMAMLDLTREITSGENERLSHALNYLIVAVIPVANPDGFADFRRVNAHGADLNRDWQQLSQPETRCISRFASDFHPAVIADEHEWTRSNPGKPNWVEVSGDGPGAALAASDFLARKAVHNVLSQGLALEYVHDRTDRDDRLAHRHFASQGISSMLLETSPLYPDLLSHRVYKEFTSAVMIAAADAPASLYGYQFHPKSYSRVIAADQRRAVAHRAKPSPNWYLVACMLACLLIMMSVNRRNSKAVSETNALMSKHERKLSLYETLQLDAPTRAKLELLKLYHPRSARRNADSGKPSNPQRGMPNREIAEAGTRGRGLQYQRRYAAGLMPR
jgi:hypothetical protein